MKTWQLDKVRAALLGYRALKSWNGRQRPWSKVVADITPKEEDASLLPEALRRFAMGINKRFEPEEKLDEVIDFLIKQKILTADELEENWSGFAEVSLLHDRLADAGVKSTLVLLQAKGSYAAHFEFPTTEAISLTISLEPSKTMVWAEEEHQIDVDPDTEGLYKRDRQAIRQIRRGYGFCLTKAGSLNLFLRGSDRDDLVHYVGILPRNSGNTRVQYFLRYGGDSENSNALPPDQRTPLHDMFVVNFTPQPD